MITSVLIPLLIALFIIALEVYTGFALIGWAGDNLLVERAKSPGPYWFVITLHSLIFIVLPLYLIFLSPF